MSWIINMRTLAGSAFLGVVALAAGWPLAAEENAAALAQGKQGVVVGTSGPLAVQAGLEILQKGGSAADAAMATALAQVVECGGSYVSHAGILAMVYYDAQSRKVYYLNACFDTPREEKEPLTIPRAGTPSGRTALVPGYMAGVQAALDRFGKLPRREVFAPAVTMAERGINVSPLLARFFPRRKQVLSRLPETKRIFTKEDGSFYAQGDHFRQPELARTLQQIADHGASYMYTGAWAEQFVAAVQREGGKITMADMQAYKAVWEEPLRTEHRGHQVYVPGFSSFGGATMIEAMHLLALADLPKQGHFTASPESLFRLMQIGNCQVLGFLGDDALKYMTGLDVTLRTRIKPKTAAGIWERMQQGKWPFAAKIQTDAAPPNHSDGVVVVDRWGNVAAVTHSINTVLWGDTGLFVGGISIPDSATFQQDAIRRAGPGNRLLDPMCPLLVMKDGKPVLASSAIGGGLHQRTVQILSSVLDFGRDPQAAVEQPAYLLPEFTASPPTAQVEKGQFDAKLLDAIRAKGQAVKELSLEEAGAYRGYWIGIYIDPQTGLYRGIGTRKPPLPSVARGY